MRDRKYALVVFHLLFFVSLDKVVKYRRRNRIKHSTVQNRTPVASKEHHINEEGEADAEEVARDQADEEGRGAGVAVGWSKSVGSNSIR